jgi:hypothetical protein
VPFLAIPFLSLASRTSGEEGGEEEGEAVVSGVADGGDDRGEPLLEVERGDVSPERERGNFIRGMNPVLVERRGVLAGASVVTGVVTGETVFVLGLARFEGSAGSITIGGNGVDGSEPCGLGGMASSVASAKSSSSSSSSSDDRPPSSWRAD